MKKFLSFPFSYTKYSLFVAMLCCCFSGFSQSPGKIERILIDSANRGFILQESKTPYHPWGVNYGNDKGLMDDFWDTDWETLAGDFREIKEMGGNMVRIHLQYGKFMSAPNKPIPSAFKNLSRLLKQAEDAGIYVDITGLGMWRASDIPAWFNALEEKEHWAAQAYFWKLVAKTGKENPVILCYDLVNEPLAAAGKREPGKWPSGTQFGGYDFLQYISLDLNGRKREDIPVEWIKAMKAAIRSEDKKTFITVGMLPWTDKMHFMSGFIPEKVAKELDYLSVHIYPETKNPGEAMRSLQKVAVGKPVVIEETFPLSCSLPELETFLRESKSIATGWVWHYNGLPKKEADSLQRAGKLTFTQAIYNASLEVFTRLAPEFTK